MPSATPGPELDGRPAFPIGREVVVDIEVSLPKASGARGRYGTSAVRVALVIRLLPYRTLSAGLGRGM